LKALADDALTAGCVLANLHHRRIVPLMERPLRIFEMHEDADPVTLAQSRLMPDLLPREYAATRVRRAIDLRAARSDDAALWAFTMLPVGPLVSGLPPPLVLPVRGISACFEALPVLLQIRAVNTARSDPSTPRARARARAAQRREQDRAARKKERSIRRRERRERRSEEFRLREQQGLSSPGISEYLSLGEEEGGSVGGRAPPERWEPSPPRPGRRGGGRHDALGGRKSARRQATYERGDARRGDSWGCGGGHTGGGNNVHRAPEEKETRVFHPEVGDCFPLVVSFGLIGV
jgi:hypothetical protein